MSCRFLHGHWPPPLVASVMTLAFTFLIGAGLNAAGADQQGKAQHAEIEGVVTEVTGKCPNVTFTIGGKRLVTDGATRFDDGACADIVNGTKVEVDGITRRDGTLRAAEIDFD